MTAIPVDYSDTATQRALITGWVLGSLLRAQQDGVANIQSVTPEVDLHGDYNNIVRVVTSIGTYRIAIIDEALPIQEDPVD